MNTVTTTIPLVEPWFPQSYTDAVRDQVQSGFIGPGRATQEFAAALALFVGVERAVATVSGTVALSVAVKALRLEPGDEILLPAYGVISTINGFASAGLKPRLVDIDAKTGCLSVDGVAKAITARTRAVCFVNFSGYTGDNVTEIAALCADRHLHLVEDAACALGHRHVNRAAGTFGDFGTFSFSVPKVLTTGQGGAVVARDPEVLDRAAAYIDQGDLEWRRTNINRGIGTNLRFTDLQASLGLCQLHDIDARLERRRRSHAVLRARLGSRLYAVPGAEAPLHNIVFTSAPDALVSALKARGVTAARQYRTISQHPAYSELADRPFPVADHWTDRAVYLPFGMAMTPEDAARVADAVRDADVALEDLGICLMPSVVVTGGAGYLGSVITSRLLFGGWAVTVVDRLAGSGESLMGFASHPKFRLVAADVRDEDLLRTACDGASAVVHLAAVVGEAACTADQANARSINEGGTRVVLSAADAAAVRRLVMISTCSNYGVSSPDVLADEDAPLRPLGIYAASKVLAEQMVLAHTGRLMTMGLRLGTICGLSPKMRFDLLINEMARAAVLGDPIDIFAPDAWRPFLHIRDAARAVEWALQAPADVVTRQVFNVVGANYQKKQLIDLVRAHYPDASIRITHTIPDARDYRVDGDRIRERGGFSPEHTIDAAFSEVAEAVRAGVFRDPRWAGHAAAPAVSR